MLVPPLRRAAGSGSEREVTLPAATPRAYLRWVAWARRADRHVRACDLAIVRPHPSVLLWDLVARQIVEQARRAERMGRASVAPRLHADRAILLRALRYVETWQRTAEQAARPLLGLEPPSPQIADVRAHAAESLRRQLVTTSWQEVRRAS